jgi:hypothetical protein
MLAATFIDGLRPLESSTKEDGRARVRLRLLESSQKDAGCYVHAGLRPLESSTKKAGRTAHG